MATRKFYLKLYTFYRHIPTRTLPVVLSALQPLRSAGYLSTFSKGVFTLGPVLAIGTGNTPLEGIKALEPRDVFFDAPLTDLSTPSNTTWTFELSPIASTDYNVAVGVYNISLACSYTA